jgi:hydrogenase/urease accessory protein HupE
MLCALFTLHLLHAAAAHAHAMEPALIDIEEQEPGHYLVQWREPELNLQERGLRPLLSEDAPDPTFPEHCQVSFRKTDRLGNSRIFGISCAPGSLHGETIRLEAMGAIPVETVLRFQSADGFKHTEVLEVGTTSITLPETPDHGAFATGSSYTWLGLTHIAEGIDHLLFVFLLLLMASSLKNLFITITAFTIAHSITLAISTLGVLSIPRGPIEALIALSIVFLAAERLRTTLPATRRLWTMAFVFGLLHGFGFAGALMEIGIPPDQAPLALLGFNMGVELGQVLFVAVLYWPIREVRRRAEHIPAWASSIPGYVVGCAAAVWTAQRLTWLV